MSDNGYHLGLCVRVYYAAGLIGHITGLACLCVCPSVCLSLRAATTWTNQRLLKTWDHLTGVENAGPVAMECHGYK